MGLGDGDGMQLLRPRVRGVHGARPRTTRSRTGGSSWRPSGRGGGLAERHDERRPAAILEADPDSTGSLGIAISEAVEDAATHEDTNYALGSVLGHVLLHQIDHRARGAEADGARGRGARRHRGLRGRRFELRGLAYPFMADKLRGTLHDAVPRDRAGRLPDPHEGTVRLRLRRHGPDRADRADVHARARLRPGAGPRGRPPVPRRRAVALDARARGTHGGAGVHAEPDLRGGDAVRASPGDHAGAGDRATRSRARSTRRSPPARPARSA